MTKITVWNGNEAELTERVYWENEAELHKYIADNPDVLPLAGSPKLTVLGNEIKLGAGYADILAIESTGRPVIIEVKMSWNYDSTMRIVSQILFYAAFLRGLDVEHLERYKLGVGSIYEDVRNRHAIPESADQFNRILQRHLDRGDFRLVLALNRVYPTLERIIAYLDRFIGPEVKIDLVQIPKYAVNGGEVVYPKRISPSVDAAKNVARSATGSWHYVRDDSPGADRFRELASEMGEIHAQDFERVIDWAECDLDKLTRVGLTTRLNGTETTLIPWIEVEGGWIRWLTIIADSQHGPRIRLWGQHFEKLAPESSQKLRDIIKPLNIGLGNYIGSSDEILDALTETYKEASDSLDSGKSVPPM